MNTHVLNIDKRDRRISPPDSLRRIVCPHEDVSDAQSCREAFYEIESAEQDMAKLAEAAKQTTKDPDKKLRSGGGG